MVKRKKRLIKAIEGIKKQIDLHENKIEEKKTKLDTTEKYWEKEIYKLEEQEQRKNIQLEKLLKKRKKTKK